MKPLFLGIFLFVFSYTALAQGLSFTALLNLRTLNDSEAVHRKLSKKGWTLIADNKPSDELTGHATWAYKPEGSKALAWVHFFYSTSDNRSNVIQYNPDCNCTMRNFEKAVNSKNMRYLNCGDHVKDEVLVHKFVAFYDNKHVVRLLTYPTSDNTIGIHLFNAEYYLSVIQGNDYL